MQLLRDRTDAPVSASHASPLPSPVAAAYVARRDAFATERDELTRRWNKIANLRLTAFALSALALIWGWWEHNPWLMVFSMVPFAAFVVLVVIHQRLGRQRLRADILFHVNNEGLFRLARTWDKLPDIFPIQPDTRHPFAADLDLFGRASLFQLLNTTTTPMGRATLGRWLLDPAPPNVIQLRQEASRQLASDIEFREALALAGRLSANDQQDPAQFLAWTSASPWLSTRRHLVGIGLVSVCLFWFLVIANLIGVIEWPFWLVPLGVNIAINQLFGPKIRELIVPPAEQHSALRAFTGLLQVISDAKWSTSLLTTLQTRLVTQDISAHLHLHRLNRLTRFWIPADALFHWPVQIVSLWDLFLLDRLEQWQRIVGRQVHDWLDVVGETEAIAALATMAHDHPDWVCPTIDSAEDRFEGHALGHPLLPDDLRVTNDVTVGPPGSFLLVTGSNMSGKSTLLRAIGINAVLAGCGGVVCASSLRLPPVSLWTSVRVQDSLEHGVSFFMAELQRLKQVVDAARGAAPESPRLLYLLDEILQGTNTIERQIAARRIIRFLVDQGAIGVVSTHDLTLAEGPELSAVAIPVHFQDSFAETDSGPTMRFDYTLRPGLATSTNALRLMDLVGFDFATE